jgi:hypothetical protein
LNRIELVGCAAEAAQLVRRHKTAQVFDVKDWIHGSSCISFAPSVTVCTPPPPRRSKSPNCEKRYHRTLIERYEFLVLSIGGGAEVCVPRQEHISVARGADPHCRDERRKKEDS